MDFSLTEEQQLLRDAIARFVANEYSFEERKGIVASPKGWSDKVWGKFAEMGLLGVPFQEAHGGFGGSGVDLMVVMQELGRGPGAREVPRFAGIAGRTSSGSGPRTTSPRWRSTTSPRSRGSSCP